MAFFFPVGGRQARDLSGRDDKFVEQLAEVRGGNRTVLQQICHLDRSEAEWRDLRLFFSGFFGSLLGALASTQRFHSRGQRL